jgi:hypothetical protein
LSASNITCGLFTGSFWIGSQKWVSLLMCN